MPISMRLAQGVGFRWECSAFFLRKILQFLQCLGVVINQLLGITSDLGILRLAQSHLTRLDLGNIGFRYIFHPSLIIFADGCVGVRPFGRTGGDACCTVSGCSRART